MIMNELRKHIVKRYCKSAIWIDNEILDDQSIDYTNESILRKHFSFFSRIAREFQEEGVSCSLKSFPEFQQGDDPYAEDKDQALNACKELALASDIILIDWILGLPDSPDYCIEIVEQVIQSEGNRFIVILSQADDVEETFKTKFPTFSTNAHGWWSNDKGAFITVQNKINFKEQSVDSSSTKLLDKIFVLMTEVYKDYLHWTALEMAAKIKEITPKWISSLPVGTDLGVLAEHIHSTESVKETIFENLMDDLHFSLDSNHLSCLEDQNLNADKWLEKNQFIHEIEQGYKNIQNSSEMDKLKSRVQKLIPCCVKNIETVSIKAKTKALKELREYSENHSIHPIKRFLNESDRFVEFCETVSTPSSHDFSLKRGSIFVDKSNGDMQSILICISQSCDCVRAEKLMFLEGRKVDKINDQKINLYIRFNKSLFEFSYGPQTLKVENIEGEPLCRQLPNKKCIGYLRRDVVDRLAGKYWSYITRVGVNIPTLERNSRPKEL